LINKEKFITSIKQLLTEFRELFFYGYIISTTVSGPLNKHLDSLKSRMDLPQELERVYISRAVSARTPVKESKINENRGLV
jgi:hypothetical protein